MCIRDRKTHLPYDIEIQTLHIPEPEHDPPSVEPAEPEPPAMSEEEALILEQEGRAALSEMGEFVHARWCNESNRHQAISLRDLISLRQLESG